MATTYTKRVIWVESTDNGPETINDATDVQTASSETDWICEDCGSPSDEPINDAVYECDVCGDAFTAEESDSGNNRHCNKFAAKLFAADSNVCPDCKQHELVETTIVECPECDEKINLEDGDPVEHFMDCWS